MQHSLPLDGGHHAGPLFIAAKRRGAKLSVRGAARWRFLQRRKPKWADTNLLRAYRRLIAIYSRCAGVQFSEDHIVPLNHPAVCGLHCEANIALIPLRDNQRKSNTHWPDMPEQQLELFTQ